MERGTAASAMWGPRFSRFDTADAPPRERFDYWCALFPLLDMQPLQEAARYRSVAIACAGDDGTVFSRMRSAPTASHFVDGRDERVMLSLFLDGGAQVRHGRGSDDAVRPGRFNLLDCARPARTVAHAGHESLHLSFPRARVVALLGPAYAGHADSFRHLPDTPLAQVLKASLLAMGRHGLAMDGPSAGRAMDAVGGLAMAYLAQLRPPAPEALPAMDQALFEAACRYMDARLGEAALTASRVAGALRCSRAHLYRLFSRRGLSVAAYLREARLMRSRALLREPVPEIGAVALLCGYGDLPAFSKAFKRRFGMAPGEWRREALRQSRPALESGVALDPDRVAGGGRPTNA